MDLPFHVIIKPVGDICNLDCSYCFYKEKSGAAGDFRMSAETLETLTRRYIEEQPAGCRAVQFVWQGGEPTLAGIDFYAQALRFQARHCRPGMRIENAIQTNGFRLDEDWFAFLETHGFQVGLSIDGRAGSHDAERRTHAGRSTHAQAVATLRKLQARAIPVNLLAVVHAGNVADGRESYRYLRGLGADFLQFLPVIDPSPDNRFALDADDWGDFLIAVFEDWLENGLGKVSVQLFDVTFNRIAARRETLCIHARQCGRQLAVERNGEVFCCDHFVAPEFNIGNIAAAPFEAMFSGGTAREFTT
ncbi:MAG: radical SAM protein, partial [Rhodoblastus sp.]